MPQDLPMKHDPRDLEWQRRYEQNDTPWDKGVSAPALTTFLRENQIAGRVLVPGCGRGHDVRALGTQPNISVVGLDISSTAVAQAKELSSPSDLDVNFIVGDFFDLPSQLKRSFDWLVEHTCFCAIKPEQRPDYVLAAASALRMGGKIFGIFISTPTRRVVPRLPFPERNSPNFSILTLRCSKNGCRWTVSQVVKAESWSGSWRSAEFGSRNWGSAVAALRLSQGLGNALHQADHFWRNITGRHTNLSSGSTGEHSPCSKATRIPQAVKKP